MILIEYALVISGVIGIIFALLSVHVAYVELGEVKRTDGPLKLVGLRRLRQNYLLLIILLIKTIFGAFVIAYSPFDHETYEAADLIVTWLLVIFAASNYLEIRFWPWGTDR